MMNVGGEQSLTAPAREMLLKLIIYARRELTRNHQTTGKYNTAFNALQGYFSSVFVFCQLSQVKMLSHFHNQKSFPREDTELPPQITLQPRTKIFRNSQQSQILFSGHDDKDWEARLPVDWGDINIWWVSIRYTSSCSSADKSIFDHLKHTITHSSLIGRFNAT